MQSQSVVQALLRESQILHIPVRASQLQVGIREIRVDFEGLFPRRDGHGLHFECPLGNPHVVPCVSAATVLLYCPSEDLDGLFVFTQFIECRAQIDPAGNALREIASQRFEGRAGGLQLAGTKAGGAMQQQAIFVFAEFRQILQQINCLLNLPAANQTACLLQLCGQRIG